MYNLGGNRSDTHWVANWRPLRNIIFPPVIVCVLTIIVDRGPEWGPGSQDTKKEKNGGE